MPKFFSLCVVLPMCVAAAPWAKSCRSTDTATDVLAGLDLAGKLMLYTGADGNLASQATLALARANASLILACRTLSKCEAARSEILASSSGSGQIETSELDLSSKQSIHDFANRTLARHPKIDALINSAATYGTFMTADRLVGAMEVNLLGPALLSHLLLPALGRGRIVNVAAAAYGAPKFLTNRSTTVQDLVALCTAVDANISYFGLSKFLMVHWSIELAQREPTVATVALAPGVAFKLPNWLTDELKHRLIHFPYPAWLLDRLPSSWQHFIKACLENEAGLASCPETQEEGAAVIVAAAAWNEVETHSGAYLDFDTKPLPSGAPNVYGPWVQSDPTCVPRTPDPMDLKLRSDWYDEMLRLMGA